jgi:uncharacterized protein (UPF0332 family)
VIASFRQHFVKTGLVEAEYSRIYERLLDDRQLSDYDVEVEVEADRATADVEDARRFLLRIDCYLHEGGWL